MLIIGVFILFYQTIRNIDIYSAKDPEEEFTQCSELITFGEAFDKCSSNLIFFGRTSGINNLFIIQLFFLTFIGTKKGLKIITPISFRGSAVSPGSVAHYVNFKTMYNQFLFQAEDVNNEMLEACSQGDSGALLSLIRYVYFHLN